MILQEATVMRIALLFDSALRPETTGVYCRRALGEIAEVEHYTVDELATIDPNRFDAYVHVDDGLRYTLPSHLRPSIWWAIDTHMDLDWAIQKARTFDFVFAAQKDGAESLRNAGVNDAEWLPLACAPPHSLCQQ